LAARAREVGMSAHLAEARYRRVRWAIIIAAAVTFLAWLDVTLDARRLAPPTAAGPVLPGFAQSVGEATLIVIQTKDATYRIARTDRGWALRDKGDYPVRRERLAQFTQGLEKLTYVRPMTRDPGKLDRLALGDPAKGGDGVLVQVQNAKGAFLANLVIGFEPRGLYVRDPGNAQSWAVKGDLPALQDPAAWLDLAPLKIDPARIASVDIAPPAGGAYSLARDQGARDFHVLKPFDRYLVISPEGVNAAGDSIAALSPINVAAAPAIGGEIAARLTLRTFDGLVIDGELYNDRGGHWLKLVAHGENPKAQEEAQAINARAAPWAYGLSDADYAAFAPPLWFIVRSPNAPALSVPAVPPTPAAPPP
jgi:hypothetical protein